MRRLVRFAVVAAVAAVLPGCGREDSAGDELRAAISATREEAAQFVYTDERPDESVRVAGVVEDDFRFKALVSLGDKPAYEEVVSDDALALRFLDPQRLTRLVDGPRAAQADRSTEIQGVDVGQVLQSGRWLVDPDGAPPVAAAFATAEDLGKDPVFDAVSVLDYVEQAVNQATSVDEWREDSLDPTYRESEDTFAEPEEGSGVTRYDLRRPRLPAAADLSGSSGGGSALPGTQHFRKMAIYVKDGRVIRVLERIEVTGKAQEDLQGYFESLLKESQASKATINRAKEQFEAAKGLPNGGALLLRGLSSIVEALGDDPIFVRNMTLELDLGETAEVTVPTDNMIKGNLDAFVVSRAAKTAEPADEGAKDEPAPGDTPAGDAGATAGTGTEVPAGDGATPPADAGAGGGG